LVHGLYALVWRDPPEDTTFLDAGGYHSAFRSKAGWAQFISSNGFVSAGDTTPRGFQRQYYHCFRKEEDTRWAGAAGSSRDRQPDQAWPRQPDPRLIPSGHHAAADVPHQQEPPPGSDVEHRLLPSQLHPRDALQPAAGVSLPAAASALAQPHSEHVWHEHTSKSTGKT
jgi:hypothetical protein